MQQFDVVRVVKSSLVPDRKWIGKVGTAVQRVKSKKFATIAVCFDASWQPQERWAPRLDNAGVVIDEAWNTTEFNLIDEYIVRGLPWGIFFEDELENSLDLSGVDQAVS